MQQTIIVVFRGPSVRQAELVSASTHPAVVARTVADLIEIDGDNSPELQLALDESLAALRPAASPTS